MPVGKHGAQIRRRWARKSRPTALLRMITVPGPTSVERSIRWPVVISVEDEHYTRRNSVNHRRNADESCHRGENGKGVRRDEPGREQAEATKEGNPTSSTRSPRVVAGRPLHGMRIASSALACPGKDESPGRRVPRLSQSHRFYNFLPTRMAASSTTALDNTRIALATSWSKLAGGHTVGFCGHLTTITGGWWLPGSTSSMVMVWPFRVPLDSGVAWDIRAPRDVGVPRPGRVSARSGHFCCPRGVSGRVRSCAYVVQRPPKSA